MIYKNKTYAWVNQKTINGKTYTAWRNIDNPKDTIIFRNKKYHKKAKKLKDGWEEIK